MYSRCYFELSCRINVFALIIFHITLSDDLDDLYIAELEEEEAKRKSLTQGSDSPTVKTPL